MTPSPFRRTLVLGATLFLGAELALLRSALVAAQDADEWARRSEEALHELRGAHPAPTAGNLRRLRSERTDLASAVASLEGRLPRFETLPRAGEDDRFETDLLVAALRESAAKSGAGLRNNERFGLPAAGADRLERERIRALAEFLFRAGPSTLIGIEMASVTPATAAPVGRPLADAGWKLPASLSLRTPGLIDTSVYRLRFEAPSATLRAFLHSLATTDFVVRLVEVAAATDGTAETARFTVAMELPGIVPRKSADEI